MREDNDVIVTPHLIVTDWHLFWRSRAFCL